MLIKDYEQCSMSKSKTHWTFQILNRNFLIILSSSLLTTLVAISCEIASCDKHNESFLIFTRLLLIRVFFLLYLCVYFLTRHGNDDKNFRADCCMVLIEFCICFQRPFKSLHKPRIFISKDCKTQHSFKV
jgi:uncharacterized membrane protein YozB (DUF420 family)